MSQQSVPQQSVPQVVVLAYGPGFHTHAAVRRARELTGPAGTVAVVGALPTAREGMALLALDPPPGVVVVAGEGTAALRTALEGLAEVPTLVLHDDVTIDADSVARLARAHDTVQGTMVPVNDEPDSDHHPGVVPAAGAPLAVRRVRPSCLLALPSRLLPLTARALVDPRVRLDDVSWGFHVVPGATATHPHGCTERLLPPTGPDGRPLLVAAVIARDEERTLPGLFASLEGLVDRIELCDTGSSDDTVAVARAAGCHVIERTWRDDFAWARNEVLDQCLDAWYVLSVDADDRIHCADPVRFRRQLATFRGEIEAYALPVRSRLSMDLDVIGSEMPSVRVFQPGQARWWGRLHELPCRPGTGDVLDHVPVDDPWVEHIGYTTEVLEGRDKAQRNIRIARSLYEEERTGKSALEYARSLMLSDADPREQLSLMQEVVTASVHAAPPTRAYVLATTAGVHLVLGELDAAHRLSAEALDLVPGDDIAARVFAETCESMGRYEELVARADTRATARSLSPAFANAHGRGVWHARVSAAYARAGRLDDAGAHACASLELAPAWFDRWPQLVEAAATAGDRGLAALVGPLALDTGGTGLAVVARRLPPRATAEVCAAVAGTVGHAAVDPQVVVTGLLAALVSEHLGAVVALLPAAPRLAGGERSHLAERFTASGHHDVAAALLGATPV